MTRNASRSGRRLGGSTRRVHKALVHAHNATAYEAMGHRAHAARHHDRMEALLDQMNERERWAYAQAC